MGSRQAECDNKRRAIGGKLIACLLPIERATAMPWPSQWGFQRGTLWHTTLRSKVVCVIRSVGVAASNAVVAGTSNGI